MILAVWAQNLILVIIGAIVAWYTIETKRVREEITRQTSISLRPVVVFEFREDAGHNRTLMAKNIGLGAAFNVVTFPLKIVPDSDALTIHFDVIHTLGSQERKEVSYRVPVFASEKDRGGLFFPQSTQRVRDLRIEYQDVEGGRYRQDLVIHPKDESVSSDGYVAYSAIQKLAAAKPSPFNVLHSTLRGFLSVVNERQSEQGRHRQKDQSADL